MSRVKAILLILLLAGFVLLSLGNMAAPKEADIGSSITFEQNNKVAVLSEVLDITVSGSQAEIVATYKMKNITDEEVSTQAMFLSPNVDNGKTKVVVNNQEVTFSVQAHNLIYNDVTKNDWKYVVLNDYDPEKSNRRIDAISFQMDFSPNEEFDVVVSYTYSLGGYPDYNFSAKEGVIYYYLAPAAMWKDFGSITINLYLDKDMPIIKSSNLNFEKIDTRVYRYYSDTLPEENLRITIDENGWQNFFSTLRSPYLLLGLFYASPFIAIIIIIIVIIIVVIRKKRKKKPINQCRYDRRLR